MKYKLSKRIIISALAAIMLLCIPLNSLAAANAAVKEARNGVVRIFTGPFMYEGGYAYATGSGFGVGVDGASTDIFVTNYHVVADAINDVYIMIGDEKISCTVIDGDSEIDFAILKAERVITERTSLKLVDSSLTEPTEEIFALGFPGVADYMAGDEIISGIDDMTVTTGTISKKMTAYDGVNYYQHDAAIHSGNSGGPLLTSEGYVIGINTLVINDGTGDVTGLYYAIYIDYIINALESNGISFDRVTDRTPPEEEEPEPQINNNIIISNPIKLAGDDGADNKILILGIAIAAVLVLVIVLIIIMLRQRKKSSVVIKKNVISQGPVSTTTAVTKALRLGGVKGVFAGRVTDFSNAVTIGRDGAKCDMIFPASTAGVSAVHCEVRPLPDGRAIITDLGSSYGTYINNGATKLSPNCETVVAPGTVIWLGSDKEQLVINPLR